MVVVKSVEKPAKEVARVATEASPKRIELPAGTGSDTHEVSRLGKKRLAIGKVPIVATETVFGADERERVYETELLPWRMICSLLIEAPGGSFLGTGWLVGPKTVITAGHCIYDQRELGGWASEIKIAAGRDDQTFPYGRIASTRFSTTDKWQEDQDPDFDIGCIHLDTPLGDRTGWFGVVSLSAQDLQGYLVNIAGYPSDLGNGRFLYQHRNRITGVSDRRIFYNVDTFGGQSGSPAWIYETDGGPPLVVGVHAYGAGGTPASMHLEANSAPRIIPEVAELIRRWIAADS